MTAQRYLASTDARARWMRLDAASLLKRLFFCEQALIEAQGGWLAAIGPLDVTRARIDRLVHQRPGLRFSEVIRPRHIAASLALALALLATSYVSTTRAAAPLDGGECGYTAAPVEVQGAQPTNFTPADFDPVP